MTYAALEAKAKSLSARGLRLALWQDGDLWYWQWATKIAGEMRVIMEGNTTAAVKPVALAMALMSI
jgi:hypothetical protein